MSIFDKINLQEANELSYSFITMKMAPGRHQVMSDGKRGIEYGCSNQFTKPSEIYINGENQSVVQPFYQFDAEKKYVKLIWKTPITNCKSMFCNCDFILEMNLTHFNISLVENMQNMFQECVLLTSIELSNFVTSNVKTMGSMFQNCKSLISLDLSGINTSKTTNIGTMFRNCSSLKILI